MPTPVLTHQMIEAFRAAIMNGGISAGADALGMSQSSVSRVIAELQKVVGFQLFVKHGRTVKPTEEALALMTKVQQSFLGLEDIARFSEQLRKLRMGRLSICAIPAIAHSILPQAIEFLRKKYPNVVVSLDIASSIEVVRSVLNRQADVGLAAHGLAVGEAENVAEVSADCVCIAAAGGLPSEWTQVELQQLIGRPFVALTGTLQKRLEVLLKEAGVELDIIAEASQSLSCSELVLRGAGISVVDPFTGNLHRLRGGIALPLRPAMPYRVQVVAMGDTRLSAQAKDLVQYLEATARTIGNTCR
ncbi:MAG: transcriptional regulator, LysR family [Ramlibacter sp.]|nr:transcriptional regulator, LysR family [Ramlibacter sp.]